MLSYRQLLYLLKFITFVISFRYKQNYIILCYLYNMLIINSLVIGEYFIKYALANCMS